METGSALEPQGRSREVVGAAFAPPPGSTWTSVSPRLRTMRRTVLTVVAVPLLAVAVTVSWVQTAVAGIAVLVGGVAVLAWGWWVVDRNWRSWGYTERADDLIVVHGALFRRMVVVPYGRMQLVDVVAEPVPRLFGLVTVRLHTAAATTDAAIHGMLPADAAALRDRLAQLGEAHAAGI